MCRHTPPCPDASGPDGEAARIIISHPEQGWSLLCNGIVVFEDTGELLPGGDAVEPHRPTDLIPAHARRAPVGSHHPLASCSAGPAGPHPGSPSVALRPFHYPVSNRRRNRGPGLSR